MDARRAAPYIGIEPAAAGASNPSPRSPEPESAMPVNVQISLNSRNRWERLVIRIADTAAADGRSLNNVAALLLPVVALVEAQLVQRHLGTAAGGFTVRAGQQRLVLRMPLPTDPICDCVLTEVLPIRHDRVRSLWINLQRDQPEVVRPACVPADMEEALEAA
jgi:hypothetical protein